VKENLVAWLLFSGFGAFCGLICFWFWAKRVPTSMIQRHAGRIPGWILFWAGQPRADLLLGRDRQGEVTARVISSLLIVAALTWYHLVAWPEFLAHKTLAWIFETSFPLWLLITWGTLVWKIELFLKRWSDENNH